MKPEIVEAIQRSVVASVIEANGREFLSVPAGTRVHIPDDEPLVGTVQVKTLTGFADFLASVPNEATTIHVEDVASVSAFGVPTGRNQTRVVPVEASAFESKGFQFGQFLDLETFIIGLQAHFVPSSVVADMLKLVENITLTDSTKLENKAVQNVTVKKGASFADDMPVPSVVQLAPFRTFPDIEQPLSPYVLKFQRRGDQMLVALFQTDDLRWKLQAVERIKLWLQKDERIKLPIVA